MAPAKVIVPFYFLDISVEDDQRVGNTLLRK
jgi:hypothetical protein